MATTFGNSLDQIGQGYANPPVTDQYGGQPQFWGADAINAALNPWSTMGQTAYPPATPTGIGGTAQGAPGVSPGGPTGPVGSVNVGAAQLTGPQYGGTAGGDTAAAPAGTMAPQPPAYPPPSGGPFSYGQRQPATGSAMNAGGFGGLGMRFAGQHPGLGARYWARLNNIGGS